MAKKDTKMVTSDFNLQKISTPDYEKVVKCGIDTGASIACFGRRGTGKTQISKEQIKKAGLEELYLNLSVMERTDLAGFPNLLNSNGAFVDFRLPGNFKPLFEGDKKVVMLLDEVDKAEPSLWAPLLELTQFHTLNGVKLPNLQAVLMTGNLISEGGNKPCLPLLDRASKFLIEPDVEAWMNWAGTSRKIHPSVTAFIHDNPNELFGAVDPDESYADPSPRSWENASKILQYADATKNYDSGSIYKMVAGCVGNATGLKYSAYFEHYQKIMPLIERLFKGEKVENEFNQLKTTEQLIVSMIVCARIAAAIDTDKPGPKKPPSKELEKMLDYAGILMSKMSEEYVLISVRSQIKIERIIQAGLDERGEFAKQISRVKKTMRGQV